MPGFIDIDLIGDTASVSAMLSAMDTALSLPAIMDFMGIEVTDILQNRAKERFANSGDDVSGGWAPLLDATVAIRESQGYGGAGPINVRTGQLENYITNGGSSIKAAGEAGAVLTYPRPTSNPELRAKVETAQIGKSWPPTVPRPVLGVNEADLEQVLLALSYHLAGEFLTP